MKCKQKLCNRNKNICNNGNCNVCDDAIKDVTKKNQIPSKPVEDVEVDIGSMIKMHKKLLKGDQVEPLEVSALLLAGVIKIINQHDSIVVLENKMKDVEKDNLTNKFRIDSLENWVLSQEKSIKDLDEKLSLSENGNVMNNDDGNFEELRVKIVQIEKDLAKVDDKKKNIATTIKCKECGKAFAKTFQLEKHLEEHEKNKQFKCEICGKEFFLQWRLNKHMGMHSSPPKACRYFANNQECPYEHVGCMFLHSNLSVDEISSDESDEDEEALLKPIENQCHICQEQLKSKDDLFNHVESQHEAYFLGIMELANKPNQT